MVLKPPVSADKRALKHNSGADTLARSGVANDGRILCGYTVTNKYYIYVDAKIVRCLNFS